MKFKKKKKKLQKEVQANSKSNFNKYTEINLILNSLNKKDSKNINKKKCIQPDPDINSKMKLQM